MCVVVGFVFFVVNVIFIGYYVFVVFYWLVMWMWELLVGVVFVISVGVG